MAQVVLEYLAPEMCPAGDFANPASGIELLISGIAIGLEQAGEALELGLRMDAAAVWSLRALSPSSRMQLTMGASSAASWPAKSANVDRSMSIPCAAIISA